MEIHIAACSAIEKFSLPMILHRFIEHINSDTPQLIDFWGKARGIDTVPVLLGPESLLLISKPGEGVDQSFDPLSLPRELRLSIYKEIIAKLKEAGATRIQIDEPALVMELQPHQLEAFKEAYTELGPSLSSLNSILMTYHGGVSEETYRAMIQLDCFSGYGFDLVNGDKTLDFIKNIGFPPGKYLHAGIVDGRDFSGAKLKILQYLETIVGEGKLVISTSSPSIDNLDGCISEAKYLARKLLTKKHTMVDIDAASSSRMLNDRVEDETIQIGSFFFDNKIGDMNRAKMSGLTVFAPAKYEVVILEDFADAEPASKAVSIQIKATGSLINNKNEQTKMAALCAAAAAVASVPCNHNKNESSWNWKSSKSVQGRSACAGGEIGISALTSSMLSFLNTYKMI
ncbi:methionine synthase protein [Canna indica]|uniref:Methionine synthase protein n=1 Tax=Canna indica TaxID=4628 RepID=A0AAQ3K1T3_9LILI|nr:methionine synthase protein [Canna indica]